MKTSPFSPFFHFLVSIILGFSTVGAGAQDIFIKFSHVVASDTPKGRAAEFFAQKATEFTKGKVKVEVYANSSLYKEKNEMEALQAGSVQMLAPSLTRFGEMGVDAFDVFDLPFIFEGMDDLHKVTQGAVGAQLLAKLEPKGIKGLAYWDNGFKSFSANTPIKTPADLKGKKLRIQASNVLEEAVTAVGGIPVAMDFSEVAQALKTGVVDGADNPVSNFYTQKMYEVQKYLTLTNHGYLGYAVVVNKKFWDDLPADVRGQLEKAMQQATAYANQIAQEENNRALDGVKKSGKTIIYALSKEQRMAFKKAMIPVHTKMADHIGKETLEAVYTATGFTSSPHRY